jgi:hypothetical protein
MLSAIEDLRRADRILEDQLTEIRNLDDPAWGPAESWPDWTDDDRWELGPAIPPDAVPLPPELAPVDPDPADREWAAENVSADEDERWSEYREWAEHVDRLDAERRALDAAYEARCRFG